MHYSPDRKEDVTMTLSREEYESKKKHEYAGPGTPSNPTGPGFWAMCYEPDAGTVLYLNVEVSDD